jgi:hypothetical protein
MSEFRDGLARGTQTGLIHFLPNGRLKTARAERDQETYLDARFI